MRNRIRPGRLGNWAFILFLTIVLTGCGDDESSGPGTGDVTDIQGDLPERDLERDQQGGDVQEDPTADQPAEVEEVEEEEELPSHETDCGNGIDDDHDGLTDCYDLEDCDCEVCNDLIDNDDNDLIDCADPFCADSPLCPEWCANGLDDDGDGDIDCADSECAPTSRCSEDPTTPDNHPFSDLMGYFYHLQYPPSQVSCCFDYTGDGVADNELMRILTSIPAYDPQLNMSASVNYGDLVLLAEWRDLPEDLGTGGEAAFNIFLGVAIDPPPPTSLTQPIGPETNLWADGDGLFRVTRDSFDDRGPRVRFDASQVGTGVLTGSTPFMTMVVPIPDLGLDLRLNLRDVKVEIQLQRITGEGDSVEIRTVPQQVMVDDVPVQVGGGKLGGYIRADDIFEFFNAGAHRCSCARPATATGPMISYGEQPAPNLSYTASCNWTPLSPGQSGFSCTAYDSVFCSYLYEICALAPIIPYILDVDANKNSIQESVSAGLFFDLSGAHLADPPVTSE
ncbi:MAG: hypothetical protein JW797_10365 [Bradymonadales bacterium]|nr:hypothetical protein [Bradymonadales bacterium]